MTDNQNLDKNSTYEELHAEVRKTGIRVKTIIPLMVERYQKENKSKSKDEVREKVRRDCIAAGYNYDYVTKWIPNDYKDYVRATAGSKGGQATAQILKNGRDEHESLPKEGAGFNRQREPGDKGDSHVGDVQRDLINVMRKLEQTEAKLEKTDNELKQLREEMKLKEQVKSVGSGANSEELIEKLESAEMEVKFLKGENVGEKLIRLKGDKADDVNQFYYGYIGTTILVRQVQGLISSGIKVVEVYMVAKSK